MDGFTGRTTSPLFSFLKKHGRNGRWFRFLHGIKSVSSEALQNFKDNKLLERGKLFEENQLFELFLDRHDFIGPGIIFEKIKNQNDRFKRFRRFVFMFFDLSIQIGSIFVFHNAISTVPFLTNSIIAESDLPPNVLEGTCHILI